MPDGVEKTVPGKIIGDSREDAEERTGVDLLPEAKYRIVREIILAAVDGVRDAAAIIDEVRPLVPARYATPADVEARVARALGRYRAPPTRP